MTRRTEFSVDEFYHIYNRGTERRIIFTSKRDYERFVLLLHLCNSEISISTRDSLRNEISYEDSGEDRLVDIGAYCLMPNHFHILIHEKIENGISRFMQRISTAYTMYFNKKEERNGALFQGVFKATHVSNDNYLKYLYSYIHLNPIKLFNKNWKTEPIHDVSNAIKFLNKYKFSSYLDYTNVRRQEGAILNKKAFPDYFSEFTSFDSMINFWLNFDKIGDNE